MKRKRGIINDEGEIKDIEQESDDGYEIPGDTGNFNPLWIIGIFIGIIAAAIGGSLLISLGIKTVDDHAAPDYSTMLSGCVALVAASTPDGMTNGNWPEPFYYGETISKVVSNCMQKTELQPYNKATKLSLNWGAIEAFAVSCSGSEVNKSMIDSPSSRKKFANCMIDANIGWRQIGEGTAESTLEIRP